MPPASVVDCVENCIAKLFVALVGVAIFIPTFVVPAPVMASIWMPVFVAVPPAVVALMINAVLTTLDVVNPLISIPRLLADPNVCARICMPVSDVGLAVGPDPRSESITCMPTNPNS